MLGRKGCAGKGVAPEFCLDGGSCRRRVDDRRETTRTNMSFSGSKSRLCTAGSNGHDLVDLSALAHLVVLGPAAHLPCSGFVFSRLGVSPHLLCEVGPGGVTWSGPGVKDRVSNGRMCCKEPLMLRSGRLQSRQVAGRARGAGLPAPGLAEGRAHRGANRVGACCGEGQGAEQAHLAGEEGRSSRSPMDQKTYNNRSHTRSGGSRNVGRSAGRDG